MDKRHSYTETLIHSQCISGIVRAKFMKESQKKEPQPTPERASTEALCFSVKIDLYSDISGITDFDGKTYGAMRHPCSEGRKSAIFNLYPDRF